MNAIQSNMTKSYYLVSKPLQYFNVTNIADGVAHKVCLIVDVFFKAEEFFNNIKNQHYWNRVLFFSNSYEAYQWLKNTVSDKDYLYIDSDYGLKKTIWLSRINSKNIYVYEEGTGSYRNDLIKISHTNYLLTSFLKFLGIKEHMGGGRYTKGIIIYDVEKHKKLIPEYNKIRKSFKSGFMQHVPLIKHHFSSQMEKNREIMEGISSKNVILYLTSWQYNANVDTLLSQYPDYIKILKPHPHIKTKYTQTNFDYILSNDVLVEIFIINAIEVCKEILVFHENSGAMQYIDSVNINSILL